MDVPSTIVSVALILIVVLTFYGLIPLAYAYNVKTSVTPKKYRIICLISLVIMYILFTMAGYLFEGESLASVTAITFWTFVFYKVGIRIMRKRGYLDDGKSIMLPNEKAELCPFCETGVSRNMRFCPSCGYDLKTHFENNHPEEDEMPLMKKQQSRNSRQGRKLLMVLAVVIIVLIAALFGMTNNTAEEESVNIADVAQSVLYVEIYDENGDFLGTASGFLVKDTRTLVTNYHVVENADYLCAYSENNQEVWAEEILYCDVVSDLAVLLLEEDMDVTPLIIADSEKVRQGDEVYAVGYPLGIANTISDGIVSSRYYDYDNVDIIQTTAAASRGNSGGPLVNNKGHVIGIICSGRVDGQNLNLAVSSNTLVELMSGKTIDEEDKAWEERALIKGDEDDSSGDSEKEEAPVEQLPETKDEPEETKPVVTPEQSAPEKEEKKPEPTPPAAEQKKPEPTPPVKEEKPPVAKEEKEPNLVLVASEEEVTIPLGESVTVYFSLENRGDESYTYSVSYRGSQLKADWGDNVGNGEPLTIHPWEKGEFEVKVDILERPDLYKIIKVHAI